MHRVCCGCAPGECVLAKWRQGGRKAGLCMDTHRRAKIVFTSMRRSMTSSTIRFAIESALFGTIPCQPNGMRSITIPRNLMG